MFYHLGCCMNCTTGICGNNDVSFRVKGNMSFASELC